MDDLLHIERLNVGFPIGGRIVHALKEVSLTIKDGEAVGIVGESGSGKSLTAMAIMRLLTPPGIITGGEIRFLGRDLLTLNEQEMRRIRGKEISIIFQDSMTSLNPTLSVGRQLIDVITTHRRGHSSRAALAVAEETMVLVGLPPNRLHSYPHELSGGMRQRVLIAMAVACMPRLLIADEPTTALDVTVQAQIINLLKSLRKRLNLSIIFITHNLDLMSEICDRGYVVYGGRVMESAPVKDLFLDPLHPYSRRLLNCVPRLANFERPLSSIPGRPPALESDLQGCPFEPRCDKRIGICRERVPSLTQVNQTKVACWVSGSSEYAEPPND